MSASVASVVLSLTLPAAAASPDYDAAAAEGLAHLKALIAMDTSNPPGNEVRAAGFLRDILSREGIAGEILESSPGRGSLVARLKGRGKKRPLLLMGHLDVVPVERDRWSVEPFAGVEKDGYLYGRGAMDDKGMVVAGMMALLVAARSGTRLDRDVIFLAEADEEQGGAAGMKWLVENHWDRIAAEYALNEGGRMVREDGRLAWIGVQCAEKVPVNVRIIARGRGGHASVPLPDNPVFALAAALARIRAHHFPVKLSPTSRAFFSGLARAASGERRKAIEGLLAGDPAAADRVSETPTWSALLRNTVSATILKAGIKSNVIPSEAEATLNCRLLPGEDAAAFVSELSRVVADPAIEFVYALPSRPAPAPVSFDTPLFRALTDAGRAMSPGAVTVPYLSNGATDSSDLRARGVAAYGILPFPMDEDDLLRMHGNDERLPIASFRFGVEYLHRVLTEFAGK